MPDAFFKDFLAWVTAQPELNDWASDLPAQLENGLAVERWGDLPQWQSALDALPNITPRHFDLTAAVTIGAETDLAQENRPTFRETLMQLHPWRKGPFHLFGTHIDTEWRSDWKWDRIESHLTNLHGNLVLDVGCGNGYHCLRLLGAGAKRVVGIDPSAKFVYQFQAIKKYLGNLPVDVLPLGIEQMPPSMPVFDTVLSMGVLYHRKDPVKHIQ
ncbi:MAG: tRNA 5-methoxyuridine(34)/uridine 5-oxyacetic acid(34) synthase CmoB, partial [bacterium]